MDKLRNVLSTGKRTVATPVVSPDANTAAVVPLDQLERDMSLGLGVMLGMLGPDDTVEIVRESLGKTITALSLADDVLRFEFSDQSKLELFDGGQSCCEHRYMQTDDDLSTFVGDKLVSVEVRDAPNEKDEYGEHEVQFLVVQTDKASFTMASHNEHNGYYGGFHIQARRG